MTNEDIEFVAEIVEKSSWLFYGDLDEHFDDFLKEVLKNDLKLYGFGDIEMSRDFAVAYWLLISELVKLDLVEYGTSPRGAWFTEKGERFKKVVLGHENAIRTAEDFIHGKYNR